MANYRGDDTTGFQSPAQDYIEPVIDLSALLDLRKPGLYPVRVVGQELRGRGIQHGDILIANAAAEPAIGKVCVAFIHGEVMLATLPADSVRDMLTVTGQRTHAELRGIACHPFGDMPAARKSIACTRSFGRAVTDWHEMREAVAAYAARAAEKLRRFGLKAGAMQVFVRTNEFNNDPRYANQATFEVEPTADSLALVSAATQAAAGLWRNGYRYAKAGVLLLDLYRDADLPTADMFASRDPERSKALMMALDALNGRYGRDTVRPGGISHRRTWSMRRANLSPCYTTRISDVMEALAR